jgi:hypothetical protein
LLDRRIGSPTPKATHFRVRFDRDVGPPHQTLPSGAARWLSRLTAEGVVGAVLSVIHARMLERVTASCAASGFSGSHSSAGGCSGPVEKLGLIQNSGNGQPRANPTPGHSRPGVRRSSSRLDRGPEAEQGGGEGDDPGT